MTMDWNLLVFALTEIAIVVAGMIATDRAYKKK
jgi:hypothetical protein